MRRTVIFFTWLIISADLIAQHTVPFLKEDNKDTFVKIQETQTEYLDSLYLDETGLSRMFVKGKCYIPYYNHSQQKPVLRYNEARTASLVFDGRKFDDIILQYDTFRDQIFFTDKAMIYSNIMYQVALCEDNISRFELYFLKDTMIFRYIDHLQDSAFSMKAGFYEVAHDNKCRFLIRHSSVRNVYDVTDEYTYSPAGYINIGDGYSEITTKRRFVKLFGEESDAIRNYIKMKDIKFKNAGKQQITDILKYYEALMTESN